MAVGLKIIGGDIVINRNGTLDMVSQTDKCRRDFMKMIVTSKEFIGNETSFERYNPFYGTELNNLAMYRGLSRKSIRDVVIIALNESISQYITLQESRNNLDLGEVITGIDFEVFYDVEDQRYLAFTISMTTAQGVEVNVDDLVQYVG
jgi:hypothetical protein